MQHEGMTKHTNGAVMISSTEYRRTCAGGERIKNGEVVCKEKCVYGGWGSLSHLACQFDQEEN